MPEDAKPPAPDLEDLVRQATELGNQFKAAVEKVAEDAQMHIDREVARLIGQHPELYAELQKTIRQVKKTVDKAADELGLRGQR